MRYMVWQSDIVKRKFSLVAFCPVSFHPGFLVRIAVYSRSSTALNLYVKFYGHLFMRLNADELTKRRLLKDYTVTRGIWKRRANCDFQSKLVSSWSNR